MRKHTSIDQLSVTTARQAQSQAAQTQRDLRALRDSVAGLNQKLRALNPVSRAHTKAATTGPSGLVALGLGVFDAFVSGGYSSAAQNAGKNLANMALGQRIR